MRAAHIDVNALLAEEGGLERSSIPQDSLAHMGNSFFAESQ
jgi:hypothetical protein